MRINYIKITHSRAESVVCILLSVAFIYKQIIFGLYHLIFFIPNIVIFSCILMFGIKGFLFPLHFFSVDADGIKISCGWLIQRTKDIPWNKLLSIEKDTIQEKSTFHNLITLKTAEYPVLKLVFDSTVDLGKRGYYHLAHPTDNHSYVIGEKLLKQSLPEVIEFMQHMYESN